MGLLRTDARRGAGERLSTLPSLASATWRRMRPRMTNAAETDHHVPAGVGGVGGACVMYSRKIFDSEICG